MKLKKYLLGLLTVCSMQQTTAQAQVLENFESYTVGTKLALWNYWGNTVAGTGEIVKDPTNANNKVLHVTISGWGNFAQFPLPTDLQGAALAINKTNVTFRIYRTQSDQNDYKKVQIYQDKALLFEDEGYPHQGNKGEWQWRSYNLPKNAEGLDFGANGGKILALGFNSDNSDYYIDDIAVKGEYDDYETIDGVVKKDISKQNTSSSYETIATPFRMMPGSTLNLYTARYTYITSPVIGEGTINIYGGGERTYLGGSDKYSPDWSAFKGDVHIYPHKELSSSNGFYGVVWMHNGKTFSTSTALTDMTETKPNSTWLHSNVFLHKGATLASESGTRGIRIGRLETEEGSQIYGFMKTTSGNNAYYVLGFSGEDSHLAGKISPFGDNTALKVGIFKEGNGTYRITGNTNNITGGVTVLRGRVLVNNDAAAAKAGKLLGGVGNTDGLTIRKDGIGGGTGSIGATSNVYGILQPGDDGIGTLTFANYASATKPTLIVRPTARIDCEIGSTSSYDKVIVDGPVSYYNTTQDFETSDQMPRLRIQLTKDADLHEGDTFTLLTASKKESYQSVPWEFNVIYPKAYTWTVEQIEDAEGFKVVAKVTSVIYTGQGDVKDEDDKPESSDDDGMFDVDEEQKSTKTLRSYIDGKDMYIGTCVPVWSMPIDRTSPQPTLIRNEFNMVVCENEMKFDATEPQQGSFSYNNGDKLVNFANYYKMRVRGHALAWHSQVPSWLTDDGNKNTKNRSRKELLDILHNHIKNLVTHWKGKIQEWDVANEVLSDNQYSINSNPKAYDLRPSVWATGIGEDFLDSAFVWAHKYDPEAKLILNDYSVEGKGWGKSEALYNLAMRLKNSGIPIHGVGLQSHMDAGLNYISSIEANIKRYKDAGMDCHITELDLGINSTSSAELQKQAESFYSLVRIAMRNDNCKSVMIWGLSDDITWRPGKAPLLFTSSLQKKPAYWGVHAALRQAVGENIADEQTDVNDIIAEETTPSLREGIYNLQGQRVSTMRPGQIYIINNKRVKK